jgi:hypothetical protein
MANPASISRVVSSTSTLDGMVMIGVLSVPDADGLPHGTA